MGKKNEYDYEDYDISKQSLEFIAYVIEQFTDLREICLIGQNTVEEEAKAIKEARKMAKKIRKGNLKYLDLDFLQEHAGEIEREMRSDGTFMSRYR